MNSAIKDKIFAAIIITLVYASAAVGIQRDAESNPTAVAQGTSDARAETQAPRFGS